MLQVQLQQNDLGPTIRKIADIKVENCLASVSNQFKHKHEGMLYGHIEHMPHCPRAEKHTMVIDLCLERKCFALNWDMFLRIYIHTTAYLQLQHIL